MALASSACTDFSALLEQRCADGGISECPASATGGGSAAGGGSTAGGGSATGGGSSAGGGAAAGGGSVDAVPKGFCRDGWCFETPLPFSNDLLTMWGTSDTDVWGAGPGALLAQWNGSAWIDRSALRGWKPAGIEEAPTWIQSAMLPDGGVWLIDSTGRAWRWNAGALAQHATLTDVQSVTARGNDALFAIVAGGSWPGQLLGLAADGTLVDAGLLPADFAYPALYARDADCFALGWPEGNSGAPFIFDCSGHVVLDAGTLSLEGWVPLIDGGVGVLANSSTAGSGLYVRSGSTWQPQGTTSSSTLHAAVSTSDGPVAVGQHGNMFNLVSKTESSETDWGELYSAWYSAGSGTIFAGGEGGVFRSSSTLRTEFITSRHALVDALWADDTHVLAAVEGDGLWERTADAGWTRQTFGQAIAPGGSCAVAGMGSASWLLGDDGLLYRIEAGILSTHDAGLTKPVPIGPTPKCGSMLSSPEGLYVASGATAALVPTDGGSIVRLPSVPPSERITGLTRSGEGLVATTRIVSASGDSTTGNLYLRSGGNWSQVGTTIAHPLYDVAPAADGGVWVVGADAYIAHRGLDGSEHELYVPPGFDKPNAVAIVETVSPPTIWVALDNGAVLQHVEGSDTWTRLSPPWGAAAWIDSLNPMALAASSNQLFLGGSRRAILSRPIR